MSERGRMARRVLGVGALFLVVAIGFLPPRAAGPALEWRDDLEAALADARAAGRYAVVDFHADWCLACRELDLRTLRHPAVARLLSECVRVRVDASRTSEPVQALFERFGVASLPELVVIDPRGEIVEPRIASVVDPDEAAATLRRAGLGG